MTDIRHVTTVALDEATPEATLVKIDVEGAEYRVLKGMKKLMEKQGFRFIIEIEPDRQGFSNEVYDLLEGWKLNKLDSLNMLCEQEQERI
jgi:hypothetical protein